MQPLEFEGLYAYRAIICICMYTQFFLFVIYSLYSHLEKYFVIYSLYSHLEKYFVIYSLYSHLEKYL